MLKPTGFGHDNIPLLIEDLLIDYGLPTNIAWLCIIGGSKEMLSRYQS